MATTKVAIKRKSNTATVSGPCPHKVTVEREVSILPTDYPGLNNLPSINGVTLIGDKAGSNLSLLSNVPSDYDTVSLLDAGKKETFVVVLGVDGEKAKKVPILDFTQSISGFTTNEEINPNVAVGAYQFVEVKNSEGTTNGNN